MRDARRRLARLEAQCQQRVYACIARECGLTVETLLQEAEAFLAQPLETQLAEVDAIAAAMAARGEPWEEVDAVKQTLTAHYQL